MRYSSVTLKGASVTVLYVLLDAYGDVAGAELGDTSDTIAVVTEKK